MRSAVFTFPGAKILKCHNVVKRLLFIVFGICFLLVKTNGQDQKVVDSLISVLNSKTVFQERENIEKIAEQNEVLVLKEEIIYRQWVLNIVTGFLGFTTLALLIFVFRNYRQKRSLNVILDRKIKERTHQLELSRDELLKAFRERDILITRASDDINETLSTIRGLCLTGAKDVSDPAALLYMDEIDKTSHHLARNLKSLFRKRMGAQAI